MSVTMTCVEAVYVGVVSDGAREEEVCDGALPAICNLQFSYACILICLCPVRSRVQL